jgi:hypothetical protein
MKMRKNWKMILSLVLVAAMLAGCSAKNAMDMEAPMESMSNMGVLADGSYYRDESTSGEAKPAGSAQTSPVVTAQKLIRTMSMDVETDNMDDLLAFLDTKVAALGGYMEERNVRNGSQSSTRRYRYANMTIRVPVERLDEMVEHISGRSNVVNYQENADDITLSYVATQSRLKALEVEQERLLELLAKADNMTDLLQIEQRLTEVRTELENVASRLRLYDNLVDYGTVELQITEVQVFTVVEEETVWQRIGSGLSENWRGLCNGITEIFVFLISSLPYLIPLTAAVILLVLGAKRRRNRKAARMPEEEKKDINE